MHFCPCIALMVRGRAMRFCPWHHTHVRSCMGLWHAPSPPSFQYIPLTATLTLTTRLQCTTLHGARYLMDVLTRGRSPRQGHLLCSLRWG